MADIINFDTTKQNDMSKIIEEFDLDAFKGWTYEERVFNPETGESLTIMSGPVEEIVANAIQAAILLEDKTPGAIDDAYALVDEYVAEELRS